jgi:Tfp pilus assembly protein PilN
MRAVNLIPPERRRGGPGVPSRSGGAVYVVLGGLAGLVIMGVLWAVAHQQAADRRAQGVQATADAVQADARAAQLAGFEQFADLRDRRLQAISALATQRADWSSVMREIASTLPGDVRLLSFNGSVTADQGAATGAVPHPPTSPNAATGAASHPPTSPTAAGGAGAAAGGGPTVQLSGCATSQPEVADVMNRLRAIAGVTDVGLASSEKSGSSNGGSGCSASSPQFSLAVTFGAQSPAASGAGAGRPAPATSLKPGTASGGGG